MFFPSSGAAPPSPGFAALDRLVQTQQLALAALAWELRREWQNPQDYLGLDLEPTPHFFRCSYAQLETLNQSVERQIQELLGLLLHHDPEGEVAIIALAQGQVKLLYFQPQLPPPQCLGHLGLSLDDLIIQLETELRRLLTP
jgi:hypothetical protein